MNSHHTKPFALATLSLGDDSGQLPLAATYVIDRDGVIRWAFLDADYRNRAEPADVIRALAEISSESSGG